MAPLEVALHCLARWHLDRKQGQQARKHAKTARQGWSQVACWCMQHLGAKLGWAGLG